VALAEDKTSLCQGVFERRPSADPDGELAVVGAESIHPPHSSNIVWLDDGDLRGRFNTSLESDIHADCFQGCVVAGLLIVSIPNLNTTFLRLFGRELVRVVVPGY
jgi:hypothetical protein